MWNGGFVVVLSFNGAVDSRFRWMVKKFFLEEELADQEKNPSLVQLPGHAWMQSQRVGVSVLECQITSYRIGKKVFQNIIAKGTCVTLQRSQVT